MDRIVHGVVHGKTIELDEDPGMGEGQQVEITLKTLRSEEQWGEGLRRCAWGFGDGMDRGRRQDPRGHLPGPEAGYA